MFQRLYLCNQCRRLLIFQPKKFIKSNCLSLKVSMINTIRLQIYLSQWQELSFIGQILIIPFDLRKHIFNKKNSLNSNNCFPLFRLLHWSDLCTGPMLYFPTFSPVRSLYQSDVCTGPTFVLPDVYKSQGCTVQLLY